MAGTRNRGWSESRGTARLRGRGAVLAVSALVFMALGLGSCSSEGQGAVTARPRELDPTAQSSQETSLAVSSPGSPTEQDVESPTVTPPAPLAASVSGQYIFLADYQRRLAQYEQALVEQGLDLDTEMGQDNLSLVGYDVLESMIDSALIQQAGIELGVALTGEELAAKMEEDITAGGGQAAFEEWLEATDQTRADYADMLEQSLLSQRILDLIAADLPETAEQVHARHIMVEEEVKAEEILNQLQQGADFAELAVEQSQDLATSDAGGDLGWLARGLLSPELDRVAFSLELGQTSGVVPADGGFYIIQVLAREEVRELTPDMIVDLKLSLFDEWLEDQRGAAVIERFVGE